MVSTGPDREHTILLRHPYRPDAEPRSARRQLPSRSSVASAEDDMLTDDGKHLYVSWDEYHLLIERLALKIARVGLAVRPDPVPRARRHAAGRRALARLRQAARDHGDELVSRRGRHDPGPARPGEVHHAAARRARRARAARRRSRRLRRHACARSSTGCAACRRSASCARRCSGPRASRRTRPTTTSSCCRRARGSISRSRSTTICGPLDWRRSSRSEHRGKGRQSRPAVLPTFFWCPGRDSNPHGVTR